LDLLVENLFLKNYQKCMPNLQETVRTRR
jgi:hypothetical protein